MALAALEPYKSIQESLQSAIVLHVQPFKFNSQISFAFSDAVLTVEQCSDSPAFYTSQHESSQFIAAYTQVEEFLLHPWKLAN
jgi:hypothetical protein